MEEREVIRTEQKEALFDFTMVFIFLYVCSFPFESPTGVCFRVDFVDNRCTPL